MNIKEIKRKKQKNALKKNSVFCILLILLCLSCSKQQDKIELIEVKSEEFNITEKGALINNIREGYWITLSEKKAINIESFYVHGKLNGPIILRHENGKIMSHGYMENDSTNGLWKYYHDNGTLSAEGKIVNGDKSGLWSFYTENGQLDLKILYENGVETKIEDNHLSVPPPPSIPE